MQIRVSWPTHEPAHHQRQHLTDEEWGARSEGYLVAVYYPGKGEGGTQGVVLEDGNPNILEMPLHRLIVDNDRSFLNRGVVAPSEFGPRRINR